MIAKTIYCPKIICNTNYPYFTSNGLMFEYWIPNLGFPGSKALGDSKLIQTLILSFDPNEYQKILDLDFVTQRKLSPCNGSVSQRQLNHDFSLTPIIMGALI